jgi:16S rRNA processing protein RimM
LSPDRSWIDVAVIGAAHGVSGDVRVKALTGDPQGFARYGPLFVSGRASPLEIAALTPYKDGLFVVRFAGISDRSTAESLKGLTLRVRREQLPDLGNDEYYYADLVGLAVICETGRAIGEVVAIDNFGAGDILQIRAAGAGDTLLIPFNQATVRKIDLGNRHMVVAAAMVGSDRKPTP